MTIRKRRQPTPHFKIPPPYEPIQGDTAPLKTDGVDPYCALMQVAAEDTHANYVICRGYDTRIRKFIDYEDGNADKPGFAVAKPYGNRTAGQYEVGQVFPALLPLASRGLLDTLSALGQNPGVAADSSGHPADLDEVVEILYTDEGIVINWMLVDGKPNGVNWAKAEGDWDNNADPFVDAHPCDNRDGDNEDETVTIRIYLPRVIDADPAIYDDNVFAWEFDSAGARIGAKNYFNGKIGELRAFTAVNLIPEGWEEMDGSDGTWDAGGKALIGRDTGGDYDEQTPGNAHGERYHGNTVNDHDPHTIGNHDDHPGHTHTAHTGHTHDDHPVHNHSIPVHGHTTVNTGGVDRIDDVNFGADGDTDPITTSSGIVVGWNEYVEENGVNDSASGTYTGDNASAQSHSTTSAFSHNTTSAQSHSAHATQYHSSTDNRGPRLTVVWAQRVK